VEGFESVRRSPRRTESRAFARKPCPLSHAARRRIHDHTGKKKFSIIPDFNLIDKVKAARPQIMKKPGSGMASSGFNPLNRFCPGASDQPFQLSVVNTRSNKSGRSRVHPEKIHTCSGYQIKFQNSSSFVLRQRK
jgi:hypothetical protein